MADRWVWEETSTDWRAAIERPDIDAVDISLPNHLHPMEGYFRGCHVQGQQFLIRQLKSATRVLLKKSNVQPKRPGVRR